MLIVNIQQKLPSLNDYINKLKSPKGQYLGNKFKKDIENDIIYNLKWVENGLKDIFNNKVIMVFEWHEKTKKRDIDNVISAKKYILDAMQSMGVLENDNPAHITEIFDCVVYDKTDKVVIYILKQEERKKVVDILGLDYD